MKVFSWGDAPCALSLKNLPPKFADPRSTTWPCRLEEVARRTVITQASRRFQPTKGPEDPRLATVTISAQRTTAPEVAARDDLARCLGVATARPSHFVAIQSGSVHRTTERTTSHPPSTDGVRKITGDRPEHAPGDTANASTKATSDRFVGWITEGSSCVSPAVTELPEDGAVAGRRRHDRVHGRDFGLNEGRGDLQPTKSIGHEPRKLSG